ncbi:hypothetical protein AWC38_SpisGene18841 [Stylophora pistillata]|uniref:Uncharacterized protein n=2 Tax=Stylophora pistillata TaxID=50429 RepID=A0A2B4RI45_STYPI|nr:hypothetical protein AWC38_SpisGene18841 [Stylophora pistillata]
MPPRITMEDLADNLDSTDDEKVNNQSTDSPELQFTESSPKVISDLGENKEEDLDAKGDERDGTRVENSRTEVEKINQESEFDRHGQDEHSRPTTDFQSGQHESSTYRNSQAMDYSHTKRYHRSIHLNELDEDVIIMRAKVALRRANRLSPTKSLSSFSFDPQSLTLSDLSLNGSAVWDPVRMSTPVVTESGMSNAYRNYTRDNDSHHSYKSYSRSHQYKGAGVTYTDESGLGRSEGEMPLYSSRGISGKRLSPAPAVEDIQWRKQHGDFERHYPLFYSWKKPSSPLFSSQNYRKWQLSQTHPMSYVEWKALYWRPPQDVFGWRNGHPYHTDRHGYDADFKRSSWPSRPVSSKLIYGSRPLSPPVTFPPAKFPRAVPGGFVSKIALPSYQDSDSGYSEWSRSISRKENILKSQHSSSGFARDRHYYY